MAIYKIKMQQKRADAGYDVLYPETEAAIVHLSTYAIAGTYSAVTTGDTLEVALGKIEKKAVDAATGGLTIVDNLTETVDGKVLDATQGKALYDLLVSGTVTMTNKRITKRIGTETSSATTTINADNYDQWNITALAVNDVIAAPTGTPTDGQQLIIRIKDAGAAKTLGWNAIFRAIGVTLPLTTVISKTLYVGCKYNVADSKWDVLAVGQEA